MRRLILLFSTASLLAFGAIAVEASVVMAAKGPRGPRGYRGFTGPRGPRGFTGPAGPVGPQGPTGPAGTSNGGGGIGGAGSVTTFNALVPYNGVEAVTVGQFTIREQASASDCNKPQITDNAAFPMKVAIGVASTFGANVNPATPTDVVMAADTANNLFAAVLTNGVSEVSGNVTDFNIPAANGCVTTGLIQGG